MSPRRLSLSLALCALALAACGGGGSASPAADNSQSPIVTPSDPPASNPAPVATSRPPAHPKPAGTTTTPARVASSAPPASTPRATATTRPTAAPTTAKPSPTAKQACPNSTASTSLSMVDNGTSYAFSPTKLSIACGGVVHITNNSTAPHTMSPSRGGFTDSGDVEPTMTASVRFSYPGSYGFFCSIHPYMTGTVNVT